MRSRQITEPLSPAARLIIQRRIQMFIHSYLYYVLDTPIISDHQWQKWANELAMMQRNHPKLVLNFYDQDFADWDGSTGMYLPQYPWVVDRGQHLLHLHDHAELRAGHLETDPDKDIQVRIDRTRDMQMADARELGRAAAGGGKRREHPAYRKRIEIDAWQEGFDEVKAPAVQPAPLEKQPVGQMSLF
jgi:hypothetical protein